MKYYEGGPDESQLLETKGGRAIDLWVYSKQVNKLDNGISPRVECRITWAQGENEDILQIPVNKSKRFLQAFEKCFREFLKARDWDNLRYCVEDN